MLVKRLRPLPIEAVVRGYLAGSGWKEYREGGAVCGVPLPAGLGNGGQPGGGYAGGSNGYANGSGQGGYGPNGAGTNGAGVNGMHIVGGTLLCGVLRPAVVGLAGG